ncbi:MAG: peptidylprolyl isomerase, partial [Deltaproteobacteria bacterium]|nr:peptidylprolyl isomerase [Deltaproteobacteria bacterium]
MEKRVFCLLFVFFLLMPFPSAGKVLDRVVGVVDGEVITLSDLEEAMGRYGKATLGSEKNPLEREIRLSQVRKEVLEMLIEEKLLQKVALRFGIKVKDEEVEKTIERMKREGKITDAQMETELTSQGFTLEGYRHFLKAQIRKARIIQNFIKPKISMDEGKIREYYRHHVKRYQRPPQIRVRHILIKVPPDASPEGLEMAKEKMKRVLQRLREGAEFEEVAILYSEDPSARSGGDLGFFKKGEMVPALEEVVFKMETGEVSGVIRSSQG